LLFVTHAIQDGAFMTSRGMRFRILPVALQLPAFILLFVFGRTCVGEDFSSINLWNAGIGGYATYRIPGIVTTKRGTILAYAAARRSLGSDWADTDIVLRRSADGGRTFSPSRRLAGLGHGTTDNPTAIADPRTGSVYMLFQQDYARCYFLLSNDDGRTFSSPVDITYAFDGFRPAYQWNVLAPGPGHAIVTHSGRIVVPVWLAAGIPSSDGRRPHRPSAVATVYSDDHGHTWNHGNLILISHDEMINPSETAIAELSNGSILLNLRNESPQHRRIIAISPDGVSHWSSPVFDQALFEPICAAGLIRFPAQRGHSSMLLFSNPDSSTLLPRNKVGSYPRQRLTVRASFDDGKTWPIAKLIDAGPSAYSDLTVSHDGIMLCLYESGTLNGKEGNVAHITLARFSLSWLQHAK
jgi:sialidase-1